ncbi:MAG TPA: hypothetical protein PKO15_06895 [Fibrobacteria bacterium]|nr:hypothetical protein [Fibrobacteria bacterium]HOX51065.1 hypothetical protein [Fibrobacteria bacterium]
MRPYQDHAFAYNDKDIQSSLAEDPETLGRCLDGWLASRKAEIDPSSLRILAQEGDLSGSITLTFQETQWQACRMETGCQSHRVTIPFRIQGNSLILSTLPRDAFGERQDDI